MGMGALTNSAHSSIHNVYVHRYIIWQPLVLKPFLCLESFSQLTGRIPVIIDCALSCKYNNRTSTCRS